MTGQAGAGAAGLLIDQAWDAHAHAQGRYGTVRAVRALPSPGQAIK